MAGVDMLIIFGAEYLVGAIAAVAGLVVVFKKEIRVSLLVVLAAALPLSYLLARLAGLMYYHEQPFLAWGGEPLVPHVIDNTFPSDHVLMAAVLASAVFMFDRRIGLGLWAVTACVAVARIAAGLHYPVDVATSALLAIGTVAGVYLLLRRFAPFAGKGE